MNPPLEIVYSDESLLVVNKPQGLATTPGNLPDLCSSVFTTFPEVRSVTGYKPEEGGLLNRLDNETGGLVLFARTESGFAYYKKSLDDLQVKKRYIAVVTGNVSPAQGIIEVPIAHHYSDKSRMVTIEAAGQYKGKPQFCSTGYSVLCRSTRYHLLSVTITKGVRHQIRVHLASRGFPIEGDKLYNKKRDKSVENHLLFSYELALTGLSGSPLLIRSPVPDLSRYFPEYTTEQLEQLINGSV